MWRTSGNNQLRLILSFRRYKCPYSIYPFDSGAGLHYPNVFLKDYQSNLNIFIFEHLYQVNTREFFTAEQGSVSITEAICLTHRKVVDEIDPGTNIEYCHQKI